MSIGSHFENLPLNINISIVAARSFQPNVTYSVYRKMLQSGHLYKRFLLNDHDFPCIPAAHWPPLAAAGRGGL